MFERRAEEAEQQLCSTNSETLAVLTVDEKAALLECESVIRQERGAFLRVGNALARIRKSRLYREKYKTFENYCDAVWDMSGRQAFNLRSSADIVGVLQEKNFAQLPATESQARPLFKLPREEWAPAWEAVVTSAPDGKVTQNHVAQVVQGFMDRLKLPGNPELGEEKVQGAEAAGSTPRPVIDVEVLSTREKEKCEIAREAQAKLIELQNLLGSGDWVASSTVLLAIQNMDALRDHLERRMETRKVSYDFAS